MGHLKVGRMIADSALSKSEEVLGFKDPWFGLSGLPEESDHSQESEKKSQVCTILS